MAIPYLDVSIISRSAGQSAVASASYRAGESLYDERARKTFDYTRKEDVLHTEIMKPRHAPKWTQDRGQLWNAVEKTEKRKDAQLARSFISALPRELSFEQNLALVRGYATEQFVKRGMIVDFAIHESTAGDGGKNPHVHIMLTMRDMDANGFAKKKNRMWNSKDVLQVWRDRWEVHVNTALDEAGADSRISMASYKQQGIDKQAQEHMGHGAWNLEKKGTATDKGNRNREVKQDNAIRDIVKHRQTDPVVPVAPMPRDSILRRHYQTVRSLLHGTVQNMLSDARERASEGNEGSQGSETPESGLSQHRERLRGFLHDEQSGMSPERVEMQGRIMNWTRGKLAAIGKSIGAKATSWVEREQIRQQEREEPDYER